MNRGLCGGDDRLLQAGPWLAGSLGAGRLGDFRLSLIGAESRRGMLVILVLSTKDTLFSAFDQRLLLLHARYISAHGPVLPTLSHTCVRLF